MSQSTVKDLFASMADAGVLSQATMNNIDIEDLGETIQAGLGINLSDVKASDNFFNGILLDDSGSVSWIREDPNDFNSPIVGPRLIADGHDLIVDAITATKQGSGIFGYASYISGKPLYSFDLIDRVPRFKGVPINADHGSTPLRDGIMRTVMTILAKAEQADRIGNPSRSFTTIVTDGEDIGSRSSVRACRLLIEDTLKMEVHRIAAIGIGDSKYFKKIFEDLGIPLVFTAGANMSEIRAAFDLVSQASQSFSQGAGSLSQAGGAFAS